MSKRPSTSFFLKIATGEEYDDIQIDRNTAKKIVEEMKKTMELDRNSTFSTFFKRGVVYTQDAKESVILSQYPQYMLPYATVCSYNIENIIGKNNNNGYNLGIVNEEKGIVYGMLMGSVRHSDNMIQEIKDCYVNREFYKILEKKVGKEYADLHLLRDYISLMKLNIVDGVYIKPRLVYFTRYSKEDLNRKPFDSLARFFFPDNVYTPKDSVYKAYKEMYSNSLYLLLSQISLAENAIEYKLEKERDIQIRDLSEFTKHFTVPDISQVRDMKLIDIKNIETKPYTKQYEEILSKFADSLIKLANTKFNDKNYKSVVKENFTIYLEYLKLVEKVYKKKEIENSVRKVKEIVGEKEPQQEAVQEQKNNFSKVLRIGLQR